MSYTLKPPYGGYGHERVNYEEITCAQSIESCARMHFEELLRRFVKRLQLNYIYVSLLSKIRDTTSAARKKHVNIDQWLEIKLNKCE